MNCRLLANLLTCLLAYLPTCELANLPTILTMLSRRASRLPSRSCSFRSSAPPAIPSRHHRIVSPPRRAIREAGRFFSHQLVSFAEFVFPNIPRRFPQLILSDISPSVCNEIFFYLTVAMLDAKK